MHPLDAVSVGRDRPGALQSAAKFAAEAPTAGYPVDAALERRFWMKAASGLTALAHFNCWSAADMLASLCQGAVQPLLSQANEAPSTALAAAIATATSPLRDMARAEDTAPSQSAMRWPLTYIEAREWLSALVRAYQEAIRAVWYMRSPESDASLNPLAQRCFSLIAACESLLHDMNPPRDVLSWRSCSVVLPAYNEAENISDTVRSCIVSLSCTCPNFQIIVVDDGSRDATGAIADQWAEYDASVVATHNYPNKGYGGALLAGFSAAQAERIFFMDSDGQFDIGEIAILLRLIESGRCQIAVGYRAKRSDPFMRKLNAWGWKLAARQVVGLKGIKDIDCAFKLLPTDALRSCRLVAQGASVNVEMLLKFQRMGLTISQTPVKHMPRTKGSPTGAKPQVILRAFGELFRLRRHMRGWEPSYLSRRAL